MRMIGSDTGFLGATRADKDKFFKALDDTDTDCRIYIYSVEPGNRYITHTVWRGRVPEMVAVQNGFATTKDAKDNWLGGINEHMRQWFNECHDGANNFEEANWDTFLYMAVMELTVRRERAHEQRMAILTQSAMSRPEGHA